MDERSDTTPLRPRLLAVAQQAMDVIDELDRDRLRVPDEGEIDGIVAADVLDLDVDLDEGLAGSEVRMPVERGRLVERRTDREQHVDVVGQHSLARRRMPRETHHAERQRVALRK